MVTVQQVTIKQIPLNAIVVYHKTGIASLGRLVTTFQRNAFPRDTAVLTLQVGLMVNTQRSRKA